MSGRGHELVKDRWAISASAFDKFDSNHIVGGAAAEAGDTEMAFSPGIEPSGPHPDFAVASDSTLIWPPSH